MNDEALNVSSGGRSYRLVLNVVSESMPGIAYFERTHHVLSCLECHQATRLLVKKGTIYFAVHAGICIAAYLEAELAIAYRESEAAVVCIPFDHSVYLCLYQRQVVRMERVVSAEEADRQLHSESRKILVVSTDASDDVHAHFEHSQLLHLPGMCKAFRSYRLRPAKLALYLSAMFAWKDLALLATVLGVVLYAYHLYGAHLSDWLAEDMAPELAPAEIPPPTHYASTASYGLQFLNDTAARLRGVSRRLGIRTIDLVDSEISFGSAASAVNGKLPVLPLPYPDHRARPLSSGASQMLREQLGRLPVTRVSGWETKPDSHIDLTEARIEIVPNVHWGLDLMSGLVSEKPARIKRARLMLDKLGRLDKAELTLLFWSFPQ